MRSADRSLVGPRERTVRWRASGHRRRVDGVVHDTTGKGPGARLLGRRARRHDLGRRPGGAGRRDTTGTAGQPRNADRVGRRTGWSTDEGQLDAQYEWTVPRRSSHRARDTHAASARRTPRLAGSGTDRSPASAPSRSRARVKSRCPRTFSLADRSQSAHGWTARCAARRLTSEAAPRICWPPRPRQIVFRTTQTVFGDVPIRFTDNGRMTEGVTRAMGVRLSATSTQLVKGQRATLTTTVTGLGGITEPATLAFRNLSPAVVQIEGGAPRITIQPRDVKADGTYVDTRRLTGLQAGGFQIVASVSRPALSRFNVAGTIDQRRERLGGPGTIQDRPRRARPDPALGARGAATARGVPQAAGVERRRPSERVSVVALALLLRPSRQPVVFESVRRPHSRRDSR